MITSDTEREAREAGINPHLFGPRPIKIESPPPEVTDLKASADSGWVDDDWGMNDDSPPSPLPPPPPPPLPDNQLNISELSQSEENAQILPEEKDCQDIVQESKDEIVQEPQAYVSVIQGSQDDGQIGQEPQAYETVVQEPQVDVKVSALDIKRKHKPVMIKSENGKYQTNKKYNLRPKHCSKTMTHRSKKVKYQANLPKWVPKEAENCFRDSILTEINIQTYHLAADDEFADKVINITSISKRSQLDSFVHSSKKFVAICWLTTLRIFEYILDKNMYLEVKRIPNRYIPLSPQLLTSVHCDSNLNFYLAYLWGAQEDEADTEKPYIEIRDLYGNLLIDKPFYYDHVVQEIYSENFFIYVRLSSNILYVHRKNFFRHIYYRIDFNVEHIIAHINPPIINSWVVTPNFDSFTKLVMLSASSNQLFITKYTIFSHRFINSYSFTRCPNFKIVSINKYNQDYIIHRNTPCAKTNPVGEYLSEVDIVSISNENHSFEPHINLTFHYFVIQVRLYKDCIYLFAYRENLDGAKFFEIGCISIEDLTPKWTTYLNGVDTNTQILVHSDNIAIIKSNQQVSSISTLSSEKHECRCCKLCFLKLEDKKTHEDYSTTSIFGFNFGMNKIQKPPKKITRKLLDYADSDQIKTGGHAGE